MRSNYSFKNPLSMPTERRIQTHPKIHLNRGLCETFLQVRQFLKCVFTFFRIKWKQKAIELKKAVRGSFWITILTQKEHLIFCLDRFEPMWSGHFAKLTNLNSPGCFKPRMASSRRVFVFFFNAVSDISWVKSAYHNSVLPLGTTMIIDRCSCLLHSSSGIRCDGWKA